MATVTIDAPADGAVDLSKLPRRLRRKARVVGGQITRIGDEPNAVEQLGGPTDLVAGLTVGEPGTVAEGWRRLGYDPVNDPAIAAMVERDLAPMAGGMPTGAGALAFQHNLPAPGTYQENTELFFSQTERNEIPQAPIPLPAFGAPADMRIPQIGLLANIRMIVKGQIVVSGGGAVTATYQWPWNLLKRIGLNVNGQTGILSAEGLDYRARRQRVYRNPREEVSTAPATDTATGNPAPGVIANGTYAFVLVYDIPVAHDDYNLAGALYAQSDANQLSLRVEMASQAELFTIASGGAVAIQNASIFWTVTVYDIPFGDTQRGRIVLLPDLSWIHGLMAQNQPFNNTGEVAIGVIRTAGQLLALMLYLDNGGAAQIDPLALSALRFQYGGNRRSREFNPPEWLIEKNVHDYNGRIRPGYAFLDHEVDNPRRDLVYPKGVTELQLVATIPAGTTINANAHSHLVSETMFAGR